MRISDWSSDVCSSDLWPLPRVLLNIPADASRLALLQPAARIDRVAVAAQFEIQRRPALAAGIADAGDRIAALDLRPGVLEQGVVVGVQAHVAVAVVDDQDQPVRWEEHKSELQSLIQR